MNIITVTMNQDPIDTLSQDDDAVEAERLQQAQRAQERDDMRWLMAHAQGRRVVWRHLSRAGIYRTTFVLGAPDGSAFNEGRRALGLEMQNDVMTHAPVGYVKMTEENTGR